MSDQENPEGKIFFDSNRFPWERQYTDGKGNWYFSNELNLNNEINLCDPPEEDSFSPKEIFLDSNNFPWEPQYTDRRGNWYFRNRTVRIERRTFVRCINSENQQCTCSYVGGTVPTPAQCEEALRRRPRQ